MGRLIIIALVSMVISLPANALNIRPLPKPKELPKPKALPELKSLPLPQALPKLSKLPKAKALPKPKALAKPNSLPEPEKFIYLTPGESPSEDSVLSSKADNIRALPEELLTEIENENLQDGILSLKFNNLKQGDIKVLANDTLVSVYLYKETLLSIFYQFLAPEIYLQLRSYYADREWINRQDLVTMGFDIAIDSANLVADLNVPPHYRKIVTKHLGGSVTQEKVIDVQAAAFSASLTPYWSRSWRDKKTVSDYVDLDAAVNVNGWVVENSSTYDNLDKSHKRKITRLVRDFPDQVTRLSIGDVEYKTTGLMGNKTLTGFSITREFSLQPNLLINPVAHQRIFVESESTVKIFVNDIPRQTLQLQPGYYDLQDFPLIDGINFVRVEITDKQGQVTSHKFVGFDNNKVLVPGLSDYSFTVGISRLTQHLESTEYYKDQPAYSAYAKHGITKNITLGLLSEGEGDFISGGGYGVAIGRFGTIEASGLYSIKQDYNWETGYGTSLSHSFATSRFSLSNTFNWRSEKFSYLGKSEYSALQRTFYSGTLSLPMPFMKRWRQSYSAYYEKNWANLKEYRVSAIVSGRVSKNITASIDGYSAFDTQGNIADKGVRFSFTWHPKKRISTNVSYNNFTKNSQIDITRSFDGELGTAMNASVSDAPLNNSFKGGLDWKTSLFDTHLYNSIIRDKNTAVEKNYQSFSLSSSLAVINRSFAFGRPIGNGSFAIIKSGSNLGFDKIFIGRGGDLENPDAMSYLSGSNSVTLFPNLSPYGASTLHLVPQSENDYLDLSKRKYRVFSGYRSGAVIEITKQINIYGSGVLTDAEWLPIPLVKGTFYNIQTKASSRFFTDEEGYFEVENLQPGKYKIYVDTVEASGEVTVTSGESRMIDFGILQIAKFP